MTSSDEAGDENPEVTSLAMLYLILFQLRDELTPETFANRREGKRVVQTIRKLRWLLQPGAIASLPGIATFGESGNAFASSQGLSLSLSATV